MRSTKMLVFAILIIVIIFATLSVSGCAIKFKGTDVDYEGTITKNYQFDGFEFAHNTKTNPKK